MRYKGGRPPGLILAGVGAGLSLAVRSPVLGHPVADLASTLPTITWLVVGANVRRQPGRRKLGNAMMLSGALWAASWIGVWNIRPGALLAVTFNTVFWFAMCWGVFNFPDVLKRTGVERAFLILFYSSFVVVQLGTSIVSKPEWLGFPANDWWFAVGSSRSLFSDMSTIALYADLVSAIAFGVIVYRRLKHMGTIDRRVGAPFIAGFCLTALTAAALQTASFYFSTASEVAVGLAMTLVPIGFLLADVRARWIHSEMTELLDARLSVGIPTAIEIEAILRHAVQSEELRLLIWSREHERYATTNSQFVRPDEAQGYLRYITTSAAKPLAAVSVPSSLPDHKRILDTAIRASTMALQNAQLHFDLELRVDELRESRRRIANAQINEQNRIGRNLHDGAQQRLLATSLKLGGLSRGISDPLLKRRIAEAQQELAASLKDLRDMAHGLSPEELRQFGLAGALGEKAHQASIEVELDIPPDRYSTVTETTAYFFACESIANAEKHSSGSRLILTAVALDDSLLFTAQDNGVILTTPIAGNGLLGLTDRVESIGGTFSYAFVPGKGALLKALIPLSN